jgi:hypothetical protein
MNGWIIVAVLVALALNVIFVFNRLVRLRNLAREAWSRMGVQLKRRSDLVPNLVATVQAYATHDVEVERNGDLLVTETIRVQVDQIQIRHGIFRDFPTAYKRPNGSPVVVGFGVQSVTRDGLDERWTTQGIANGVRVIIGREEILLTSGLHDYVIRYRSTRQIGFFSDYDELYWNATGNGWPFAIESAEARITLPQAVPFGQTALYTGPQGARGQDAAIVERRDGHIVFRTTKPLPATNGLTVAAAWPKGIVIPPSASELWLADNLPGTVASAGLAAVLAFYAFAWLKVGRDPPRGPSFGCLVRPRACRPRPCAMSSA